MTTPSSRTARGAAYLMSYLSCSLAALKMILCQPRPQENRLVAMFIICCPRCHRPAGEAGFGRVASTMEQGRACPGTWKKNTDLEHACEVGNMLPTICHATRVLSFAGTFFHQIMQISLLVTIQKQRNHSCSQNRVRQAGKEEYTHSHWAAVGCKKSELFARRIHGTFLFDLMNILKEHGSRLQTDLEATGQS